MIDFVEDSFSQNEVLYILGQNGHFFLSIFRVCHPSELGCPISPFDVLVVFLTDNLEVLSLDKGLTQSCRVSIHDIRVHGGGQVAHRTRVLTIFQPFLDELARHNVIYLILGTPEVLLVFL